LVAHSLGGFYATFFASRHSAEVKAMVMIDANLACYFTDDELATLRTTPQQLEEYKRTSPNRYFFSLDFEPMARQMRDVQIPASVAVIDLVAGRTIQPDPERWRSCHSDFVAAQSNRTGITAYGIGHYIFLSSPEMVVSAIAAAHAATRGESQSGWLYAVTALNQVKQKNEEFARSEGGLNQWGYDTLRNGDKAQAIKIFELNAMLYPSSPNVWDSLAEAYEAAGDASSALKNYKIALEKDPSEKNSGAKHAATRIKALESPGPRN
jgi:tetratricopeptide (TPR) repeat protein